MISFPTNFQHLPGKLRHTGTVQITYITDFSTIVTHDKFKWYFRFVDKFSSLPGDFRHNLVVIRRNISLHTQLFNLGKDGRGRWRREVRGGQGNFIANT